MDTDRRLVAKRLSRAIEASARRFLDAGLDSRIPFLRYACLGEDVLPGSAASRSAGIPVPDWKEGDMVRCHPAQAQRFNIFADGLQALPSVRKPWKPERFTVLKCEPSWFGDMRMNVVPGGAPIRVPPGASYDWRLHQMVISGSALRDGFSQIRQIEVARHSTLLLMNGESPASMSVREREYLAMLSETLYTDNLPMLKLAFYGPRLPLTIQQLVQNGAAIGFALGLMRRGLTLQGMVHASRLHGINGNTGDPAVRMVKDFAVEEYDRVYRKLFGLPIDGIRDALGMMRA